MQSLLFDNERKYMSGHKHFQVSPIFLLIIGLWLKHIQENHITDFKMFNCPASKTICLVDRTSEVVVPFMRT